MPNLSHSIFGERSVMMKKVTKYSTEEISKAIKQKALKDLTKTMKGEPKKCPGR